MEMTMTIYEMKSFIYSEDTNHLTRDRAKRIQKCNYLITTEKAKINSAFLVDKAHEMGKEVHVLYSNGIVKVYNRNTGKFITVIPCQEYQVKRYFDMTNTKISKSMLKTVRKHDKIRNESGKGNDWIYTI